jgi:hypothetical protein
VNKFSYIKNSGGEKDLSEDVKRDIIKNIIKVKEQKIQEIRNKTEDKIEKIRKEESQKFSWLEEMEKSWNSYRNKIKISEEEKKKIEEKKRKEATEKARIEKERQEQLKREEERKKEEVAEKAKIEKENMERVKKEWALKREAQEKLKKEIRLLAEKEAQKRKEEEERLRIEEEKRKKAEKEEFERLRIEETRKKKEEFAAAKTKADEERKKTEQDKKELEAKIKEEKLRIEKIKKELEIKVKEEIKKEELRKKEEIKKVKTSAPYILLFRKLFSKKSALEKIAGAKTDEIKTEINKAVKKGKAKAWESLEILKTNLIKAEEAYYFFDWKKNLIVLLIAIFITALIVGGIYGRLVMWENEEKAKGTAIDDSIVKLNQRIKDKEKEIQSAFASVDKIKLVKLLLNNHIYWTNFFKFLEDNTIANVFYGSFSGKTDGKYVLEAQAPDFNVVADQVKVMHSNDQVLSVKTSGARMSAGGENSAGDVSFTLELSLNPGIFKK